MKILIKEILNNKFEVIVKNKINTKHTVLVSEEYYLSLTSKKISKKKLVEYSFKFLLNREVNTSILSSFELNIITSYFPEFESEIKKILQQYIEKQKKKMLQL